MNFHWSDDRIAQLKKLWAENLSGDEIAAIMGAPSRSSILGKVRRLKLNRAPIKPEKPRKSVTKPTSLPPTFWTPEREEKLRGWRAEGLSGVDIAKLFGWQVTRRAVAAKCWRMGLEPVLSNSGKPKAAKVSSFAAVNIMRKAATPVGNDYDNMKPDTAPAGAKPWLQRGFGECAYPVGGLGADTLSCCLPVAVKAYCASHAAAMFTPGTTAKELIRATRRAA